MSAPGLIALTSKTRIGLKSWTRHLTKAYDRGAKATSVLPHSCIPYEELLPKPLEEVRETLGVEPLPSDWNTHDWCTKDPYADVDPAEIAGRAENVAVVDQMVQQGLSWRAYMRADSVLRERVHSLIRGGGELEDVTALLG